MTHSFLLKEQLHSNHQFVSCRHSFKPGCVNFLHDVSDVSYFCPLNEWSHLFKVLELVKF